MGALFSRFFPVYLVLLSVGRIGSAAEVDFEKEIRPLLAEKCTLCHGPDESKAGLRLTGIEAATTVLKSGRRGIVPGEPDASEVLHRVRSTDPDEMMPPPGKGESLTETESATLERWIAGGAVWPKHWAYAGLTSPTPPPRAGTGPGQSPIDAFILARLEREGLSPSPEADEITLIRRLFYDLVGLPPTLAQVKTTQAALALDREGGLAALVETLLASPAFGERWGRHWLDRARYADSDGYEKDNDRPDAWRYRDWVIEAINADMPFDQFTIEQLAGDLLPEATPEQVLATAFHRQTLTNTEGGVDREQWRVAAVMDRVETIGAVWMGLTLTCARCHTHKYDEITHAEYYQLFAYLNNSDETEAKVRESDEAWARYEVALARHLALGSNPGSLLPPKPAPEAKPPLAPEMAIRVLTERTSDRRQTHILKRGEFKDFLDQVQPATLAILPPIRHRGGQGDRLDLARWLVSGENPLPPRVIANDVWAQLFGTGLVPTPDDFGVRGDRPSHPELLEWLAAELIRSGWSRKALIRRIVLSRSYRQASDHRPELSERDPKNALLARQNRFRVDAEIIRDLSLAASGLLSQKVGGPSVFPPIPAGVADVNYNSAFKWKVSGGEDRYRRGLYTYFKRTAPHPGLVTFDCPDSHVTNLQRARSNTPLAALITLNSESFVEAAQALARRVLTEQGEADDADRIEHAFRLCLSRAPVPAERDRLARLLEKGRAWYRDHRTEAADLGGAEIPGGSSVTEMAAWTSTVRVLLNLDEFLTRG